MKTYLAARGEAGTARGEEYASRLAAMPPAEAADDIADMFALCADEDLAVDIACDLQFDREAAKAIAAEICRRRDAGRREEDRAEMAAEREWDGWPAAGHGREGRRSTSGYVL